MHTTQIWLIRHGETSWNAEQRLQGWRDIPLNEEGTKQAQSIQQYLKQNPLELDAILSSDLQRAIQTAEIAFSGMGLAVEQDPKLRERNYGIYEGHPWRNLLHIPDQPKPDINLRDPELDIPEGESLLVFKDRVVHTFNRIANERPNQRIAIVAHGGVIEMVWRQIQQIALDVPRPYRILNASVNHFSICPVKGWQEIAWNQISHLSV